MSEVEKATVVSERNQEVLNKEYSQYVLNLGDIEYKLSKLKETAEDLKRKIDNLVVESNKLAESSKPS